MEIEKRPLDRFLYSEIQLTKKHSFLTCEILFFLGITFFCALARGLLFPIVSNDYVQFLEGWFNTLKANGGILAIGLPLGDYTPPYFYILALLTYLPIDPLVSIKLVSCGFDIALAVVVMQLVYSHKKNKTAVLISYAAVLLMPTVFLNSAAWAQCDVIFVFFLMLSLKNIIKEKPFRAALWFSISFCFKLQAVFFAPLLLLCWLIGSGKSRMKLKHFLLIIVSYIIAIIPSAIAGRSVFELLTIYFSQSGQYTRISLNAPNLYLLLGDNNSQSIATAAIFLCGAVVLTALYLLWRKEFSPTPELMITLALFFAILVPFFLPHMHERYFYLADVLAVVYAFFRPKQWYIALSVGFSSLLCYLPFLFGITPIPLYYAIMLMTGSLIVVIFDIIKQIKEQSIAQQSCIIKPKM